MAEDRLQVGKPTGDSGIVGRDSGAEQRLDDEGRSVGILAVLVRIVGAPSAIGFLLTLQESDGVIGDRLPGAPKSKNGKRVTEDVASVFAVGSLCRLYLGCQRRRWSSVRLGGASHQQLPIGPDVGADGGLQVVGQREGPISHRRGILAGGREAEGDF